MALTIENYWRAANKALFQDGVWKIEGEELADEILHGDIERRYFTVTLTRKGGKKVTEQRSRQDWNIVDGKIAVGAGTSLHNIEGALGYTNWNYLRIPHGTDIPASLVVVQRGDDEHHYQIEIRGGIDMTPTALRGALDNFARNVVVRLKKMAETGEE